LFSSILLSRKCQKLVLILGVLFWVFLGLSFVFVDISSSAIFMLVTKNCLLLLFAFLGVAVLKVGIIK
jgi:hypothetical protein